METSIFQKEKGYISAGQAGEKVGYSSDYVGQLCRRRKVPARLIGRTWYVDLEALLEHKKNNQPGRKKGYSPVRKKILPTHGSPATITKAKRGEPAYLKSVVSGASITYQNEIGPLLPELFKKASEVRPSVAFELIKHAVALATALLLVTTAGLSLLEQGSPEIFSQVEAGSQLMATPVLSLAPGLVEILSESFLDLRATAFGL